MPIELNKEQQEQLDRDTTRPPIVHDPRSATRYVLIAADQYEQMLEVVEDDAEQRALRRAAARNLPGFALWRDRDDIADAAEESLRLRKETEHRPQ